MGQLDERVYNVNSESGESTTLKRRIKSTKINLQQLLEIVFLEKPISLVIVRILSEIFLTIR